MAVGPRRGHGGARRGHEILGASAAVKSDPGPAKEALGNAVFTNDPKGGDASSTKTETEPFRGQRHPRRRHGVALFPQAQISACFGILDSHIYSYVNRFPAKCGIWILSQFPFLPTSHKT